MQHRLRRPLGVEVEYRRFEFRAAAPHAVHAHDRAQVALVTSGRTRFVVGGMGEEAGAGHLAVLRSGTPHSCHSGARASFSVLSLEFSEAEVRSLGSHEPIATEPLAVAAGRLCQQLEAARPGDELALEEAAMMFFGACGSRLGGTATGPVRVRNPRERRAVDRVREAIEERCCEGLSLEELAAEAALSPFRLVRAFTAQIGLPPHAYQVQRRLARARGLIAAGVPLADVAARCGFADQSHLTRHFRRTYFLTPGHYAKLVRGR